MAALGWESRPGALWLAWFQCPVAKALLGTVGLMSHQAWSPLGARGPEPDMLGEECGCDNCSVGQACLCQGSGGPPCQTVPHWMGKGLGEAAAWSLAR